MLPNLYANMLPSQVSKSFGTDRAPLPLNLLVKIISHLDSPADLARACRTCRMLHYMCLPKLYAAVTLHSYDYIRYSTENCGPEGVGGGSPFATGLNVLVTREVAQYVTSFALDGAYREHDQDEDADVGRVPDSSMLLGSLVRVCVDRMVNLREFSWTLETKMLPMVWEGLQGKKGLQKLKVRMPSVRRPMPTVIAPPLPNLTHLHLSELDPRCYPDNIGELLYHSRKLEHLKIHFSPRMRRERDPSLTLDSLFGRVKTSEFHLKLKSIGFQNLYASSGGNFADIHDTTVVEDMTLIDSARGVDIEFGTNFVNHLPPRMPVFGRVQKIRGNQGSVQHSQALPNLLKVAHTYHLITGRPVKEAPWPAQSGTMAHSASSKDSPLSAFESTPTSTGSTGDAEQTNSGGRRSSQTPGPDKAARAETAMANLLPRYIDAFFNVPRPLFRSILTFPQWKWTDQHLTLLVRNCPSLEELGLATEPGAINVIGYLSAHLPKLTTLRLFNPVNYTEFPTIEAMTEHYETRIGAAVWNRKPSALRWLGVGGLFFEVVQSQDRDVELDGNYIKARVVRRVPFSTVSKLPLWATDVLEL